MSISAMKQALEALEWDADYDTSVTLQKAAITALKQAIEQAEKQEPVAVKHMMDWVYQLKRFSNDGRYMNIASGLSAGACYELAVEIEQFIKTALRQTIAEAEKQEGWVLREVYFSEGEPIGHREPQPVAWMDAITKEIYWRNQKNHDVPNLPLYTAPVHAIDISQEPVDETAKSEHEFEEMVKRGTKAWDGTPDNWVDDLRGGAEKQEAVAWMWKDGTLTSDPDVADGTWTPLFTAPVHARPVVHAVRCTYPQCQATNGCVGACSKEQPDLARVGEVGVWGDKREWVGLTDKEVTSIIREWHWMPYELCKVIEAKLKEKNS